MTQILTPLIVSKKNTSKARISLFYNIRALLVFCINQSLPRILLLIAISMVNLTLVANSLSTQTIVLPSEQLIKKTAINQLMVKPATDNLALDKTLILNQKANLWHYIAQQSKMDFHNKTIDDYIAWFEKRPDYLTRISRRAKWYLYYIAQEVQTRNMPIELALLPIVESAFYPFSFSSERASGLWQFIPSTGLTYGLAQNWWYDARRDVIASTKAALQYLKNLNILFDGDWLLAIAAYNAGPGRVQKAIKKNKALGKPTDFWHLSLPPETRSYVPKLLAVLKIIQYPNYYRQTIHPIKNQPAIGKINLPSQLNVKTISRLSGLPISVIYELNPGLKRWATPPIANYQLVLPIDIIADFTKKLAKLPLSGQLEWVRHKLEKDEQLGDIAKAYNIEQSQLENINEVGGFDPRNGDFVIVPLLKQYVSFHSLNKQEKLQRLERQRNNQPIVYTVKSSDSLLKIALLHRVSMTDLVLWNQINNVNLIKIGDKINITQQHKFDPDLAKQDIDTKIKITRKIIYQIRKNDTLSVLAKRFDVSIKSIQQWNNLDSYLIKYGENLVLYINIIQ